MNVSIQNKMEKTTDYKIITTEIPGLLEIEIGRIGDDRGWFMELFQKEKLVQAGLPASFGPVQQNVSYNRAPGVTRGLHAEPWDKYVSVIRGKVFAVYLDLRAGTGFGKIIPLELSPGKAVFVPKGVANSFQTLEPDTYYSYLVSDHWSPELSIRYKCVNLTDPALGISWPIPLSKAVISEKDRRHPLFSEIQPFNP